MKPGLIKASAQYLGGLALTAFFVVLLTFLFSFLGTIFCAALAGMMLGALRTARWRSIPVSLLFPLIILTLLHGVKSVLDGRQLLLLAFICFAVFWAAYWGAQALFALERRSRQTATAAALSPAPDPGLNPDPALSPPAAAAPSPSSNGCLSLEALQGHWAGEIGANPRYQNRLLTIEHENLILSVSDPHGRISILAQAHLQFCPSGSLPMLLLSKTDGKTVSDSLVSI